MPEQIIQRGAEWLDAIKTAGAFLVIGMGIGFGQLLMSKEVLTPQIIVGRALSTGGLAMAAGTVFVWYPDIPLIGQLGVAAALASLGTSGIERLIQRLFGIGPSATGG